MNDQGLLYIFIEPDTTTNAYYIHAHYWNVVSAEFGNPVGLNRNVP